MILGTGNYVGLYVKSVNSESVIEKGRDRDGIHS